MRTEATKKNQALFDSWKIDIDKFAREALNFKATSQQCELFHIVENNKLISCKSGHGTGKSTAVAVIILWWLTCFSDSQVPCTAPTADQLRDVLWARVSSLHYDMIPILKDRLDIKTTRISNIYNKSSFAVAKTARPEKPDSMQGFHAKNLFFIADEASGIANPIFIPMLAALTEKNNKLLLIGNPVWRTGFFADTFTKDNEWANLTLNAEQSSLVTQSQIDFWKNDYGGKESDEYKVRVLGEFPSQDSQALFAEANINHAMNNEIPLDDPIIWGLDIGGFGDDDSVLAIRYGNRIAELEVIGKRDTIGVANWIANKYKYIPDNKAPLMIFIDVIGIGAGVYSRLREMNIPVREVTANETAVQEKRYKNKRAEFYCEFRNMMESRLIGLPKNKRLKDELLSIRYFYDNKGRYQLVSKQKMKSEGFKSPDMADAVAFTCCHNIFGDQYYGSMRKTIYNRSKNYSDHWRA